MNRRVLTLLAACFASAGAQRTSAQAVTLSGRVHTAGGLPVSAANVFVAGTLDGTLTDSAGTFRIMTQAAPRYTLAIRRLGFLDRQLTIAHDSVARPLDIVIESSAQRVAALTVQASRYTASSEAGATLTPLEIVTIPGTAADVNRGIQTLPGVQQVDEGTGLFVRGGDFTETRVFLNEGLLLTPAQIQSPAGTFVGTLDPFLLDGIAFTSGGFGARYGDALSAVAVLNTQSRPTRNSATLSAGLAAFGGNAAVAGPHGFGFRIMGGRSDLTPVLRINGSPRQFTVAPRGADRTASIDFDYRPTAQLSLFVTEQAERLGMVNETPSVVDTFASRRRERSAVLSWRDVFGRVAPQLVLSSSAIRNTQSFGSFDLASPSRLNSAAVGADISFGERLTLRAGGELHGLVAHVDGSIPSFESDQSDGARTRLYAVDRSTTRQAAYAELDARPNEASRVVVGLRRDWSSGATLDPRSSGSVRVAPLVTLTGAFGIYHQTVDPLLQALADSSTSFPSLLPSMRARHAVAGVQIGDGTPMLRVEVYDKQYRDLAGANRDFVTVGDGTGSARGVDMIVKYPTLAGIASRFMYSYVRSVRTDPNTGTLATAAFDVPHSFKSVVSRTFARSVTASASFRHASGRPFTPVVGATRESPRSPWTPQYGAPNSERLPAFSRLDMSASWFRMYANGAQTVAYVALTNILDRSNVYRRQYTADYTSHYDIRSIFNRAVYFGGVFTFAGK